VKSREQSLSRTKPWVTRGMSRASWYRERKNVRQIPAHDSFLNRRRESVSSRRTRGQRRGPSEQETHPVLRPTDTSSWRGGRSS
jgi:hypothetical protein